MTRDEFVHWAKNVGMRKVKRTNYSFFYHPKSSDARLVLTSTSILFQVRCMTGKMKTIKTRSLDELYINQENKLGGIIYT